MKYKIIYYHYQIDGVDKWLVEVKKKGLLFYHRIDCIGVRLTRRFPFYTLDVVSELGLDSLDDAMKFASGVIEKDYRELEFIRCVVQFFEV